MNNYLAEAYNELSLRFVDVCRRLDETETTEVKQLKLPIEFSDSLASALHSSDGERIEQLEAELKAKSGPSITCSIKEFKYILGRALNTQEPHLAPLWAVLLHDKLHDRKDDLSVTFNLES